MNLESDGIREALNERSTYRRPHTVDVWPEGVRARSLPNSSEGPRHLRDELVAEAKPLLVIPDCCGAELGTCFRVKFDPHVAARVPSEPPRAWPPTRPAGLRLQLSRASGVPTRVATRRRLALPALPGSKATARRRGPVRDETTAALVRADPRWSHDHLATQSQPPQRQEPAFSSPSDPPTPSGSGRRRGGESRRGLRRR
jgi:hypothetical protein